MQTIRQRQALSGWLSRSSTTQFVPITPPPAKPAPKLGAVAVCKRDDTVEACWRARVDCAGCPLEAA